MLVQTFYALSCFVIAFGIISFFNEQKQRQASDSFKRAVSFALIGLFMLFIGSLASLLEASSFFPEESTIISLVHAGFYLVGIGFLVLGMIGFFDQVLSQEKNLDLMEKTADQLQKELSNASEKIGDLRKQFSSAQKDFGDKNKEFNAALQTSAVGISLRKNLISSISFSVRSRLNNIFGMTDMLFESGLNSSQQRYLEVVRSSAGSLLTYTDNISDYSELMEGRLKLEEVQFEFMDFLDSVLEVMSIAAAEKGVKLEKNILSEIPSKIVADERRLRQVLITALQQCIEKCEGESVVLQINVQNRGTSSDAHFVFTCDYEGTGFDKALIKQLEEPDFDFSNDYAGSLDVAALAVFVSRKILDKIKGKFKIQNKRSNKGATVEISFDAKAKVFVSAEDQQPSYKDLKILIIDEDRAEREYLAMTCEKAGFKTDSVEQVDGVKGYITKDQGYDAILLDYEGDSGELRESLDKIFDLEKQFSQPPAKLFLMSELSLEDLKADKDIQSSLVKFEKTLSKPIGSTQLTTVLKSSLTGAKVKLPAVTPGKKQIDKTLGAKSPLNILVAEDNKVNQALIRSMLERLGFNPTVVEDGKQCVEEFKARPAKYNMILMDIVMPNMDGIEATKKIRKFSQNKESPAIVAMTANVMDQDKYIAAGMNDFIAKPLRLEKISSLLTEWGEKNTSTVPEAANMA